MTMIVVLLDDDHDFCHKDYKAKAKDTGRLVECRLGKIMASYLTFATVFSYLCGVRNDYSGHCGTL